jgi:hypothetical protein
VRVKAKSLSPSRPSSPKTENKVLSLPRRIASSVETIESHAPTSYNRANKFRPYTQFWIPRLVRISGWTPCTPAVLRKLAAPGVEPDDLAECFNLPARAVARAGDEARPPAETLTALVNRLRSDGWKPGPPPGLHRAAVQDLALVQRDRLPNAIGVRGFKGSRAARSMASSGQRKDREARMKTGSFRRADVLKAPWSTPGPP